MTVSKTGFYTHEDCRKHEMGPGHPECPERLDAIQDRLLVSGVSDALEHLEAPLASLNDIELAHDRLHVAALRGLTLRLVEEQAAGGPEHTSLDSDTSINAHTWIAALRAAGAAMAATEPTTASSALTGQPATQTGSFSSIQRSRQKSHFCIFGLFSAPNWGAL